MTGTRLGQVPGVDAAGAGWQLLARSMQLLGALALVRD
jgi:hypothetical protein